MRLGYFNALRRGFVLVLLGMLMVVGKAQNQQLKGKLLNSKTGQPVPNARVEISHGDKGYTDDFGAYSLDLAVGNQYRPGDELVVHVDHSEYGYYQTRFVVPRSLVHNFSIAPNTLVSISGTVRDVDSKKLLQGMQVRFVSSHFADPNYQPPTVYSDEFGQFRIVVDRRSAGEVQAGELSVVDSEGCYGAYQNTVYVNGAHNIDLKDQCKHIRINGGDTQREVIPGCEENEIGTICVKNFSEIKARVIVGYPSNPKFMQLQPLDYQIGVWLEPGEEICHENMPQGRYIIVVDRGNVGNELYIRNVQKNMVKMLRKCETIYVNCQLKLPSPNRSNSYRPNPYR